MPLIGVGAVGEALGGASDACGCVGCCAGWPPAGPAGLDAGGASALGGASPVIAVPGPATPVEPVVTGGVAAAFGSPPTMRGAGPVGWLTAAAWLGAPSRSPF